MKVQQYIPHTIRPNSHRNTRMNNLSLTMQNLNKRWDFHVPPDRRMAKPNLSSSIHPRAIFQAWMWDLIEHINQNSSKASRGHPPQPIKQWFHLTIGHYQNPWLDWSLSKPSRASKAFVQLRHPELLTQPNLRKHENQTKQSNESKHTITMAIQEMARLGNPLSI